MLYRLRTGACPVSERMAQKMRALATELSDELLALVYSLQADEAAGRARLIRKHTASSNVLFAARLRRERNRPAGSS